MSPSVHASVVALDDRGVMITGPAGAGKSTLARALVADWTGRGRFAALVTDDQAHLSAEGGRLIARPPARIAGLVEVYGLGILSVRHLAAVRLSLVVALAAGAPRWPADEAATQLLHGVALPSVCLSQRNTAATVLAVAALLERDGLTDRSAPNQRPPSRI